MRRRDTSRCRRTRRRPGCVVLALIAAVWLPLAAAQEESARTVVGPPNPDLYEGAMALLAGDAEKGVRLTLAGLSMATNRRERLTALANLCAGYVLLDQLDTALDYCDQALELEPEHWRSYSNRALIHVRQGRYPEAERDLAKGFELRPEATELRRVRAMLLDKTDPVSPRIVIDDRRKPPDNDED